MKLLLDTHVVLWATHDASRVSDAALQLLRDPRHEVLLSAAVTWEIAIKRALGKLQVRAGLISELVRDGATALPVTVAHAEAVAHLPPHHRDPFDRLLVAQARAEGAILVSADPALRAYEVPVHW